MRREIGGERHAPRQRQGKARIALAGDRRVDLLAEPGMLEPEGAEREGEQDDGEHGGPALVLLRADDGEEDLGRQHLEIAAEHQRIAEIGQAFHEAEQEGVGEARAHERQRHGPERRPALGAQGLRGFLQGRADALHDADEHQEGDRREGEKLGDEHAGQPVDPARARHAEPFAQHGRTRRRSGRTAGSARGRSRRAA